MPASSKEFLDIQATIECGFTLKHVRDMTRTYSQRNVSTFITFMFFWKNDVSEKIKAHLPLQPPALQQSFYSKKKMLVPTQFKKRAETMHSI